MMEMLFLRTGLTQSGRCTGTTEGGSLHSIKNIITQPSIYRVIEQWPFIVYGHMVYGENLLSSFERAEH